jgi:hypothetical protein
LEALPQKNNFYTPKASTIGGMFITANRSFKELLKDEMIRQLPPITRPRCTRQEVFYAITKRGADYIGRTDEYKYKEPKSPTFVMHESMKFDVCLSFIRNFPEYLVELDLDKSYNGLKPDATIKMIHRKTIKTYDFLLETERKKTIDRVLNEKVGRYEKTKFKNSALNEHFKVLFVFATKDFDVFKRPLEYTKKDIEEIEFINKKLPELASQTSPRYCFIGFHDFDKVHRPIWYNKNNKIIKLRLLRKF